MNKLNEIMKEYIKEFKYKVGDRVLVHIKVTEGDTERIQVFDGIIMAIRGSGSSKTFTVRKISYGVGVERTFPVNSPKIEKIELVRNNKVRKAKLNYIRKLSGKAARLIELISQEKQAVENPVTEKETVKQESKNNN
ncbi:MAG: 50S ribosomal protein L19 [Elusimicrobiota bacterium]